MPTKKKGAPKKANPMAKLLNEMSQNYTPPPKKAFESVEDKWVKVHVRLMNWRALNFDLRMLESTNLHIVEQKISERHGGSVQQIKLYRDNVAPNCELQPKDFNQTLRQVYNFDDLGPYYAKKRVTDDEAERDSSEDQNNPTKPNEPTYNIDGELDYDYECIMYYDFAHFETNDPLLKTSPRLKEVLNDNDKKKSKQHVVTSFDN